MKISNCSLEHAHEKPPGLIKQNTTGDARSFLFERIMADDDQVRAIVREELAQVSPRPNHSTLYQHGQSLIGSTAYNSVRELQISHVNPRINSSSSSTPTLAEESRRNSTSSSDSRNYNNNSNSSSSSQRNSQTEQNYRGDMGLRRLLIVAIGTLLQLKLFRTEASYIPFPCSVFFFFLDGREGGTQLKKEISFTC